MLSAFLAVFLPLLFFIVLQALFWKLAARILRYGAVTWPLALLIGATIVFASTFVRGLVAFSGVRLPILLGLVLAPVLPVLLGAWCVHDRATRASGEVVGWSGALKLSVLALVLALVPLVAALAILLFTGDLSGTQL